MLCESLPRNVRILLVGDPGVGKTSLILSLVSEEFTEYAPAKAEEITIPADVTPEQVPTNIVDYSASEQSVEILAEEMTKAHVICVVYAVDQQDTLDNIRTRWLPLIREHNEDDKLKPVVLVGNKIDLIDYSTIDAIWDIAADYPEIDRCIECSAKTLTNVSEMFYNAQIAVLHPIAPIYNIDEQELTDKCKKALTRIFKLCDIDGDGLLNDYELNHFQRKCFDAPLQLQVLDEVKAVLAKNIAGGIDDDCVTLKGFLFLHCLFIQRGRNETTWTVLRKFGYDETLQLNSTYLNPVLKIPPGCTTELSYKGQQFLTQVFERYDRDRDGALNSTELKTVFSCCPKLPWHNIRQTVPTNEKGHLTLHGWMCRWTLMTLMDLDSTLANLAYLGFNVYENESQKSAIHTTREKKIDQAKKQSSRNVYQCHVIGPRSSGKSSICRSFIGITNKKIRPGIDRGDSEPSANCCINTVHVYGQEKYLVLKEIPISRVSDPLKPAEVNCDVACLVYDATLSRSFEYIARIYILLPCKEIKDRCIRNETSTWTEWGWTRIHLPQRCPHPVNATSVLTSRLVIPYKTRPIPPVIKQKYFAESKIPVLIVGTQNDCNVVRQNYLLQPEVFCNKYQILPPQVFHLKDQKRDLFVKLATMAAFPHLKQFATFPGESGAWWKAGIGVAAATLFGFMLMKVFSHNHR